MTTKQKILTILRHAKAETGTSGQEDITRALTGRGIEAAGLIGGYMQKQGMLPQKILCSGAVRTRQTLQYVREAYPALPKAEYLDRLYHASANTMLDIMAQTSESIESLLVVGHNPGIHQLAIMLAAEGDERMIDLMLLKFPTCSLASFIIPGIWGDIAGTRCTLTDFVTPSMITGRVDPD